MKHSLHPQRLILAVLLLAALVSSVCAAEVRIGKDSIYCFSAGDFADPARGIYVDALLHNLSTLAVSMKSMTNLLPEEE